MSLTHIIERIIAVCAVLITLGILLHDTKFDKALLLTMPVATIALAASAQALDFGGNAHTHVERVSIRDALSHMPRVQPRNDSRRHYLQKHMSRGDDFFGGSHVFWPNV